jgi:hypothetical protein
LCGFDLIKFGWIRKEIDDSYFYFSSAELSDTNTTALAFCKNAIK